MEFLCIDHRNTFSIKRAALIVLFPSLGRAALCPALISTTFGRPWSSCGRCHSSGDEGTDLSVGEGGGVGVWPNRRRSSAIRARGFIFNSFIRVSAGNNGGEVQSGVLGSPVASVCVFHFPPRCLAAFCFTLFRRGYLLRRRVHFAPLLNKLPAPSVYPPKPLGGGLDGLFFFVLCNEVRRFYCFFPSLFSLTFFPPFSVVTRGSSEEVSSADQL